MTGDKFTMSTSPLMRRLSASKSNKAASQQIASFNDRVSGVACLLSDVKAHASFTSALTPRIAVLRKKSRV